MGLEASNTFEFIKFHDQFKYPFIKGIVYTLILQLSSNSSERQVLVSTMLKQSR